METPPSERNYNPATGSISMEDSLFPDFTHNYEQSIVSKDLSVPGYKKQFSTVSNNQHSDLEADSIPESQMELTEVDLYTQLEHKERDLVLAAELGKSLLEKNEELTRENEQLSHDFHRKVEELQQDNHELRRKLDCKTSECEVNSFQLHSDIKRLQDDLEERKVMLVALEREKSRAVEELSEQNHKLLNQLQRASEAETQLSSQVQQLRKEFLDRTTSTSVRLLQLESENEEKKKDSEIRSQLKSSFDVMKDETERLQDELNLANERIHQLEKQLHDKEREHKRMSVELNDAHLSNRQLQIRIDEMREEMSLQMSYASNGNSSLFMELEQSGVDFSEVVSPALTSQLTEVGETEKGRQGYSPDFEKASLYSDMPVDLTLRCYQKIFNVVSNCHQHIFELKQEIWETYQRVQSVCTILRTYINKTDSSDNQQNENIPEESPHSPVGINLASALSDLSKLVHEAIHTKELKNGSNSEVVNMLKEKQVKLMQERDDAVVVKNQLEVSLARAKVDLLSVNSQLIEAIQQKLQQQKEIEAWEDDMELMIQKGLNERTQVKYPASPHQHQSSNSDQTPSKSSWFPFSRRKLDMSTPETPPTCRSNISDNTHSSRFSSWFKPKRVHSPSDQPITDKDSIT